MTEREQQIQDLVAPLFVVMSIGPINHKPHPFMIGPRHVGWASDHNGGMLSEEAIRRAEKEGIYCAQPGCRLPFDEHTCDVVVFLQFTRNATSDEAQQCLQAALPALAEHKIAGFVFVETPEKFRAT
jgi:hypothetical protein